MAHRNIAQKSSVERQVLFNKRNWAAALTSVFILTNSPVMAAESSGEPVITVIEQGLNPLLFSSAIAHSAERFANPVAAQVGASLAVGDQLRSNGGLMLQLRCTDGSQINVSGSFQVQRVFSTDTACAFDLSQGSLVAEANGNVVVSANGSILNTATSVASVLVSGASVQRWQANLGQSRMRIDGADYVLEQDSGITYSSGRVTINTLTANDQAKAANVLARLSATRNPSTREDVTTNYTIARNQYLSRFGGQALVATSSLSASEQAMNEQQLGIESAADITDLSALVVSTTAPEGISPIRRETWQLQNQGDSIGTSVSTQVQLPETAGFIPSGAITRDF